MLALEWKGRAFIEKVNTRCFCWFPAATNCPPIWRLQTKLYKEAWNVSANNSETVGYKDLRFGQIVYILVFYSIHFCGLFHWTVSYLFFCACLLRDSENEVPHCLSCRDKAFTFLVIKINAQKLTESQKLICPEHFTDNNYRKKYFRSALKRRLYNKMIYSKEITVLGRPVGV